MLKIEIYSLRLYSRLDEDAFFSRLNQIPGVVSVEGFLRTINVSVDPSAVDDEGMRELISLFQRYGIDMRQLRKLETGEFSIMDAEQIRLLVQVDVSGPVST